MSQIILHTLRRDTFRPLRNSGRRHYKSRTFYDTIFFKNQQNNQNQNKNMLEIKTHESHSRLFPGHTETMQFTALYHSIKESWPLFKDEI